MPAMSRAMWFMGWDNLFVAMRAVQLTVNGEDKPSCHEQSLRRWSWVIPLIPVMMLAFGCATPPSQKPVATEVIHPDQRDNLGGTGIESEDIRAAATKFAAGILSLPQVAQKPQGVGIAIAPVVNSSRHLIEKDLFSARLRVELNRHASDRVRFFAQGAGERVRQEILAEKDAEQAKKLVEEGGGTVVSSTVDVVGPSSGLANVDFILTGELRGLSKAAKGGARSDYILMTFQLVEVSSNRIIWEDAYEVKKKSTIDAVYQ